LRCSFSRAFRSTSCVSAANPTSSGFFSRAPTASRMSGVRTSVSDSSPAFFFTFCAARCFGR